MAKQQEEQQTCQYRFSHPNRPREICGLPANLPGDPPCQCGTRHCFWHCLKIDKAPEDENEQEEIRSRLQRAVNERQYLEGAWLSGAHLERAQLAEAHFEEAVLRASCLKDADLCGAHLEGAQLDRAELREARLVDAHLKKANLMAARLQGTELDGARLDGALFHPIRLSEGTSCSWAEWGVCGEERLRNWGKAWYVYREIKKHYDAVGNYKRGNDFYFREMRMYHKLLASQQWMEGAYRARQRLSRSPEQALNDAVMEAYVASLSSKTSRRLAAVRKIWRFAKKGVVAAWAHISSASLKFIMFVGWLLTHVIWGLHRFVWGYGVRPARTFGWMIAAILCFALKFFSSWPVAGLDLKEPSLCSSLGWWKGMQLALTMSLGAFTSVGHSAYQPGTAAGQFWSGFEGLLGMLLAAAFLVALATKYVRRG